MAADSSAKVVLRDVAIVGGGCYGTFYAGQLIQARERGKRRHEAARRGVGRGADGRGC